MSKIVILDNGHGGMIGGVYQTAGKRSPNWENGVLYEGVFNRWIVNKIAKRLDIMGIPYYNLVPENSDISLQSRVNRVEAIRKSNPNVWLLSIHSNAGGGSGIECFSTKGKTNSDNYADFILTKIQNKHGELKMRFDLSDGDKDKEADFYIIKRVSIPAILLELLFMDNKEDYKKLWSSNFQNGIADTLAEAIKEIYNGEIK